MKQRYYLLLLFTALLSGTGYAQKSVMHLSQSTLMHEVRDTPSPLDNTLLSIRHALCGRINFLISEPYWTV